LTTPSRCFSAFLNFVLLAARFQRFASIRFNPVYRQLSFESALVKPNLLIDPVSGSRQSAQRLRA
jgi:hypothetical protein